MSGDSRPAIAELANRLNNAQRNANTRLEDRLRKARGLCREWRTLMVGEGPSKTTVLWMADVSMSSVSALDVSRARQPDS